jgi:hypothetical protein
MISMQLHEQLDPTTAAVTTLRCIRPVVEEACSYMHQPWSGVSLTRQGQDFAPLALNGSVMRVGGQPVHDHQPCLEARWQQGGSGWSHGDTGAVRCMPQAQQVMTCGIASISCAPALFTLYTAAPWSFANQHAEVP